MKKMKGREGVIDGKNGGDGGDDDIVVVMVLEKDK